MHGAFLSSKISRGMAVSYSALLSRRFSVSPRKIKQRVVQPHEWKLYQNKAEKFYRLAQDALRSENWDGAALAAVHLAITAVDALLARIAGIRAASESHMDVCHLLAQHSKHPETEHYSKNLRELLGQKNTIEYESEPFTKDEAEDCFKKAERIFRWVASQIGPQVKGQ